jgi:hypothetical protein
LVLRSVFSRPFTEETFLWLQFLAGLGTAFVFYEWLCRLNCARWRAALAVLCLVFSAQFLYNTVDGEEFVVPILLLVLALRTITIGDIGQHPSAPDRVKRRPVRALTIKVFLSMLLFALAVGCRPELLLVGVVYPVYFHRHPDLGLKKYLTALPVQIGTLVVVWLPIFFSIGMTAPFGSGMNWKQAILGGGYKLAFQCFTLPVFVLLCWTLVSELKEFVARQLQSAERGVRSAELGEGAEGIFPMNFVFLVCWLLAALYCLVFFTYAAKLAYALVVVPFFLLLAAWRSPALLAALAVFTLLGLFVSVDIFKDRRLTAPHLKPGAYFEAIKSKPFYRLGYLRQLAAQCGEKPIVIVGNAWSWDFRYHIACGAFQAEERSIESNDTLLPSFVLPQHSCFLMTIEAAGRTGWLRTLQAQGFSIKMDQLLYRTMFEKYALDSPDKQSVNIDGVPVTLFSK